MKAYKKTASAWHWHMDEKAKSKDKQMLSQITRAQMKTASAKEVSEALSKFEPEIPLRYYVSQRRVSRNK